MSAAAGTCELCAGPGGTVLWRDAQLRVVAIKDADYPGFMRVVWNAHVREWSDLRPADRQRLQEVLFLVERALREALTPDKVNLASLGNAVPHLHWHVIARFTDDPHFPRPVWGERQRETGAAVLARRQAAAERLAELVPRALESAGA